jgi:hypothetical protein
LQSQSQTHRSAPAAAASRAPRSEELAQQGAQPIPRRIEGLGHAHIIRVACR